MTFTDFGTLCRTLFRNQLGKAYVIEDKTVEDMFNVFDVNQVFIFFLNVIILFLIGSMMVVVVDRIVTLIFKNFISAGSTGSNR